METFCSIESLQKHLQRFHGPGRQIGLVPSMGYLHEGHQALVQESTARCPVTIVSILKNPTMVPSNADPTRGSRSLEHDLKVCRQAGASLVFAPDVKEIYPRGFETHVDPGSVADRLCGAFRPGHFRGFATGVAKLFNIVRPDVVFFSQSDFQESAVVRQMVRDLNMPIEIVTVPSVRESDGLALSICNNSLSPFERARALCLSDGLFAAATAFRQGERDSRRLVCVARKAMSGIDHLQYLELVDAQTLKRLVGPVDRPAVLCGAVYVGATRLTDNVMLEAPHNESETSLERAPPLCRLALDFSDNHDLA
jgi:pantoate--beta-alanine ligase